MVLLHSVGLVAPTEDFLLYFNIIEKGKLVGGPPLATAKCRGGTALWHAYDKATSLHWQSPSGYAPHLHMLLAYLRISRLIACLVKQHRGSPPTVDSGVHMPRLVRRLMGSNLGHA